MNERDFVFWLHGFFEISNAQTLAAAQVQEIKNHIDLVLKRNSTNFVGNAPILGKFLGPQDKNPKLVNFNFETQKKKEDIYITISKNPLWPSGDAKYSYYPNFGGDFLHNSLGVPSGAPLQTVHTVIDNLLFPTKETCCSNLGFYKENHLIGVPNSPNFGGLYNVGNYDGMGIAC